MALTGDALVFSETFPELKDVVYEGLFEHFFVFQFPMMKTILDMHASKLIEQAVKKGYAPLRHQENGLPWKQNVVALVAEHNYRVHPCEDARVVKMFYPEIYTFVEGKFCEQKNMSFSGNFSDDIGVCVDLLMRANRRSFKARQWWKDPKKIEEIYGKLLWSES